MWIWQQPDWPDFRWNKEALLPLLRQVYFHQGVLLGRIGEQGELSVAASLNAMLTNIVHSSAIEGEKLNAFSVRSSLANKLGLTEKSQYPTTEQTDGLASVTIDAITCWEQDLTMERLLTWHAWLFPAGYTRFNPVQGGMLRGLLPMQVVSGRIDRPKVHFEAPPRVVLEQQLSQFIAWFNTSRQDKALDPLVRAAIVHLWFVTLHPFDDGNGRITRLLTDLALAQAESQSIRFYAMAVSILERRAAYYSMLESTQRGELDITPWLHWFLDTLNNTLCNTLADIEQSVIKTNYWRRIDQTQLNKEQVKVLNRLLDGEFELGISSSQYQKIAKVSAATATRHLAHLVEQKCLVKTDAGGRSTRYRIYY